MNVNRVMLLGRLTRDPEVKYGASGNAFCSWGLALNRYYNDHNGERQQETCFVDCKAFGRQAEIVGQYVQKGNPLFVEGRLSLYQYETENGEKRNKLSVIAERVQLMGSRTGEEGKPPDDIPEEEQPPAEQGKPLAQEDDIPF
jgi:single-strand DNA-binding protein